MTTIYLISNNYKQNRYVNDKNNDSIEYRMSKSNLNYEGINNAIKLSKMKELSNIDYIYTSSYNSTIETSNYLKGTKNIDIIINNNFNQRRIGVNKLTEIPAYYEEIHFMDINYHLPKGESQLDIINRMYKGILDILKNNKNKRIAIVTHKICITYLLRKWCKIKYKDNFIYKDKIIFNGNYKGLDIFKLEFNKTELIDIRYIEK